MTTYSLPFPPSVNNYWRHGGPQTFLTKPAVAFRKDVQAATWQSGKPVALTGRLQVEITLAPPDQRKRDIDNYAKGTLDALMHAGVFIDDSQIDVLTIRRGPVTPGGGCYVMIVEIAT